MRRTLLGALGLVWGCTQPVLNPCPSDGQFIEEAGTSFCAWAAGDEPGACPAERPHAIAFDEGLLCAELELEAGEVPDSVCLRAFSSGCGPRLDGGPQVTDGGADAGPSLVDAGALDSGADAGSRDGGSRDGGSPDGGSDAGCGLCEGTTPVCGGGACRACATDGECSSTEACVESGALSGACGACDPFDGTECDLDGEVCDPSTATCRGCTAHTECGALGFGDFCADGDCGDCLPEDDSGCSGATPYCAPGSLECGVCDPEDHAGCGDDTPFCSPTTLTCVGCVETSDCPDVGFTCINNLCVCTDAGASDDECTCAGFECSDGMVGSQDFCRWVDNWCRVCSGSECDP